MSFVSLSLEAAAPVRVLLLTGRNNHKWETTTPVLKETLESTGRFTVRVETNVAGLTPRTFDETDVVLSNFNTYGGGPPAGEVWNPEMRRAFEAFIRSGKGLVILHAGSSVFMDWPFFQQVAGATWGKGTGHGIMHTNEVRITTTVHPITAGLASFSTYDEFWQNSVVQPGIEVLAEVTPLTEHKGSGKPEPMALVTHAGAGRGFTLLLGHDAKAMSTPGFRQLLQRGTEWAATGRVTSSP